MAHNKSEKHILAFFLCFKFATLLCNIRKQHNPIGETDEEIRFKNREKKFDSISMICCNVHLDADFDVQHGKYIQILIIINIITILMLFS